MVKGSDGPALGLSEPFFVLVVISFGGNAMTKAERKSKKDVIATRKTCKADGTGLSHYILMDKKAK
jgi:modified peptide precursor CbpA